MAITLLEVLRKKGPGIFRVAPDDTVLDAVNEMNERGVGAVLVLKDEDLVGIFTERDILTRVLARGLDAGGTQVRDVMTRRLVILRSSCTVEEAMAVVTRTRCRHLPVFDGGTLVGLVSSGDLTRAVTDEQQYELEKLAEYITGRYPG